MAPRANWKGFLRLSLVTCPVALYPATSDSEKISFNQINRNTGHRIKYLKVMQIPARKFRPKIL
jgi:DNA end-binding protein Ku